MSGEFPIIEIPLDAPNRTEHMGSKEKFWFGPPDEPRRLFKYARPAHGEDWSEKVACEIAELLGIPHAIVELATHDGRPGIVTPDFRHGRGALLHGNELLQVTVGSTYPAGGSTMRVRQHTVANVVGVLIMPLFDLPNGLSPFDGVADAADAFVGYLLLDALVTNTDRHHENWAVIKRDPKPSSTKLAELAPTYDHASSLGRELLDTERLARLDGKDRNRTVERYLARAESRLFRDETEARGLSPLDAFVCAASIRPQAAAAWRARLAALDWGAVANVVARVPAGRMSDAARRFALRMLELNRGSLLGREATE